MIWAGILGAVLSAAAYSNDDLGALRERAHRLDPRNDSGWRRTYSGGYRTPYGIQFDADCFDLVQQDDPKLTRKEIEGAMERTARGALKHILDGCAGRYPELLPYIRQWVAHFRRTVVFCTTKTQAELKYGAAAIVLGSMIDDDISPRAAKELRDELGEDHKSIRLPAEHKFAMIYPSDSIRKHVVAAHLEKPVIDSADWHARWAENAMIHEVFHATQANNYTSEKHGEIEKTKTEDAKPCHDNSTMDRVSVLSSLCTQAPLNASDVPAAYALFKRISQCGEQRGCQNLFESEIERRSELPSEALLGERPIEKLCARIYDRGYCLHAVKTQPAKLHKLDRGFKAMDRRVRARLAEVLSKNANSIPAGLLKAFPGLGQGLISQSATPCFQENFILGEDGSIRLKKPIDSPPPWDEKWISGELTLMALSNLRTAAFANACYFKKDGETIRAVLNELRERVWRVVNSDDYRAAVIEPHLDRVDDKRAAVDYKGMRAKAAKDQVPADFRSLMGEALFDDQLEFLDRTMATSVNFDCKAAGLNPRMAVYDAEYAFKAAKYLINLGGCSKR